MATPVKKNSKKKPAKKRAAKQTSATKTAVKKRAKKTTRVAKTAKGGDRDAVAEVEAMDALRATLEAGRPARSAGVDVPAALDLLTAKPTLYLAQGVADPDPEWELEFWNRSIVTVDSLDATLGGPGPSGTPNITADGRVYWSIDPTHPGRVYDYAVEDWPCVDFEGRVAATHLYNGGSSSLKVWRLIKLTTPNRLRAECSGLYADGWSGPNDSTYFRFVASKRGWLRIRIARENWPSTPVHVQLAAVTTKYREPALGRAWRPSLLFRWVAAPSFAMTIKAYVFTRKAPALVQLSP